jgi:hypothetical protein
MDAKPPPTFFFTVVARSMDGMDGMDEMDRMDGTGNTTLHSAFRISSSPCFSRPPLI